MNFIKFLGTGGARIVVARQLRSSAGIWLSVDNTNIYFDPGPGALVKCFSSKPKLDPTTLDAIVLSHKHLDHSGDINAMIEAMTLGGRAKKGIVFAPNDALHGDPVILKYVRSYVNKIQIIKEKTKYKIGDLQLEVPTKHIHGGDTFGFKIKSKGEAISYITDTKYFENIPKYYKCDILIISTLTKEKSVFDHLCIDEAKQIIREIKPRLAVLTHFGGALLKIGPKKIAKKLSRELGINVIAAVDGLKLKL